jgi:predicted amidophosphoribosyltransferase
VAEELVKQGLGRDVLPVLSRIRAVQKSAFASVGHRASPQEHLDSFGFDPQLASADRITVVDDFITKGATLLAAASLVKHHFRSAEICVFALVRTLGLQPEIETIVDPCIGRVTLNAWGGAERDP